MAVDDIEATVSRLPSRRPKVGQIRSARRLGGPKAEPDLTSEDPREPLLLLFRGAEFYNWWRADHRAAREGGYRADLHPGDLIVHDYGVEDIPL